MALALLLQAEPVKCRAARCAGGGRRRGQRDALQHGERGKHGAGHTRDHEAGVYREAFPSAEAHERGGQGIELRTRLLNVSASFKGPSVVLSHPQNLLHDVEYMSVLPPARPDPTLQCEKGHGRVQRCGGTAGAAEIPGPQTGFSAGK